MCTSEDPKDKTVPVSHPKRYEDPPCFGYVVKVENRKIAYIPDFLEIFDTDQLNDIDIPIADGTEKDKYKGHAGIDECKKRFGQLRPKKMILTHNNHTISHKAREELVEGQLP